MRDALVTAGELWQRIGEIEDDRDGRRIARAATGSCTSPTCSPSRRARKRIRRRTSAAVARSTSVASTCRFQALCGFPGRPASGSAGSSSRGMFATPAAASATASPHRAAATETSGNENACRSPARR